MDNTPAPRDLVKLMWISNREEYFTADYKRAGSNEDMYKVIHDIVQNGVRVASYLDFGEPSVIRKLD
jgi:hypothetical protein